MAASTTVAELIKRVRDPLHEQLNDFFIQTTLTADGTTTTFTPSTTVGSNYFSNNNMEVLFVDGNNAGLRGDIISWNGTTATILEAMPYISQSGKIVQIGVKGFFSDFDLVRILNDAADYVLRAINPFKLSEYFKVSTVSGTSVSGETYGQVALPSDRLGRITKVWIDGRGATILNDDEIEVLNRGVLIDRAFIHAEDDLGYFKPRPEPTADIRFQYIPTPQTAALGSSVDWPYKALAAIVEYAVSKGYAKRERENLAALHMGFCNAHIKVINETPEY